MIGRRRVTGSSDLSGLEKINRSRYPGQGYRAGMSPRIQIDNSNMPDRPFYLFSIENHCEERSARYQNFPASQKYASTEIQHTTPVSGSPHFTASSHCMALNVGDTGSGFVTSGAGTGRFRFPAITQK